MKKRPAKIIAGESVRLGVLNRLLFPGWFAEHKFCVSRRWRFDFAHVQRGIPQQFDGLEFVELVKEITET
jgi:hypothetical protein